MPLYYVILIILKILKKKQKETSKANPYLLVQVAAKMVNSQSISSTIHNIWIARVDKGITQTGLCAERETQSRKTLRMN